MADSPAVRAIHEMFLTFRDQWIATLQAHNVNELQMREFRAEANAAIDRALGAVTEALN